MDTLRHIKLISLCFLLCNCRRIEYIKSDETFHFIMFYQWNSSKCPKRVTYERFIKNSKFTNKIISDTDFNINCNEKPPYNHRIIFPNKPYSGPINYDINLIVDDSIEFKITSIENRIDTVFLGGRPGDLVIMNSIKSLIVNGHKLDNSKYLPGVSGGLPYEAIIFIPTNLGRKIKK